MTSPASAASRLFYIDWMRGLACILMFQTHCYDAWLSPSARQGAFYGWSRAIGTLPAPLFLFLAGVSVALGTTRSQQKGLTARRIGWSIIRRGLEVFALGLLLRVQEFVIAYRWAPWTDLFRVDILNVIGISIVLIGAIVWAVLSLGSGARIWLALESAVIGAGLAIAMLTPLLWTVWRPRGLPWPLESYINGVHNLGQPQPWLFPIFPWSAFAFAGAAVGLVLFSDWGRQREGVVIFLAGTAGSVLIGLAYWIDLLPIQLYPVYDFWHTSPNFFLIRVGALIVILMLVYLWCRWGAGSLGFSPVAQLGQTSLLVYWVHIQFVYGRLSILGKRAQTVESASVGLLIVSLAMVLLSLAWTRARNQGVDVFGWMRKPVGA